jgi:hypothetical protein
MYGRVVKIGNGEDTDFWLDAWCGDTTLKEKFSDLFEISEEQNISVAAMSGNRWRMTWRRWLNEDSQIHLRQLRDILMSCALGSQKDEPVWVWGKNKSYSVKSMYSHLCSGIGGGANRRIWKSKLPPKIKVFMWLINQNAILTKDNLMRRNWQGGLSCSFCNLNESINHMFFDCYLARYVWSLIAWVVGAVCRPTSFPQF